MQTVKKRIIKYQKGMSFNVDDEMIIEEPLVINVNGKRAFFCMRLPGSDAELAAGILYSEGLINGYSDIIRISCSDGIADIDINGDFSADVKKIYSSTGGISSSDLIKPASAAGDILMTVEDLFRLAGEFASMQRLFDVTGGTHSAAIFDSEFRLISFAEDVGRHNALDKCTGSALLSGKLDSVRIVMLSSRLSFEMIKKSCRAGAAVVAGVSAPTSAAVEAADAAGITLAGFLREGRFNLYSRPERIKGLVE